MWLYTDKSILTTTFVESKLDIVKIKFDFVSYYHLPQMVPFLIAGHIYYVYACRQASTSIMSLNYFSLVQIAHSTFSIYFRRIYMDTLPSSPTYIKNDLDTISDSILIHPSCMHIKIIIRSILWATLWRCGGGGGGFIRNDMPPPIIRCFWHQIF